VETGAAGATGVIGAIREDSGVGKVAFGRAGCTGAISNRAGWVYES